MVFKKEPSLFLNTLFCIGLFKACTQVYAIPVNLVASPSYGIKYPIHIACECQYSLYVDGKYIDQPDNELNISQLVEYDYPMWNDTKKFYPVIYDESPKIIAFTGVGSRFTGFLNGFIMDMDHGKQYTKHEEWKCKDFSNTSTKKPSEDWIMYDYDDVGWEMSASYGKNFQNNSFQIFETERTGINLQAEWLWMTNNAVSTIYCRKKNEHVKTIPMVLTTIPLQTSAPTHVSTTIHTPRMHTSAPTHVSTTIHTPHVQTSAPTHVSTTIHTPHVQTSAPTVVHTSAPHPVPSKIHPTVAKTPTHAPTPSPTPSPTPTPAPSPTPSIVISPRIKIIIQNIKYSRKSSYQHVHHLFQKLKIYNEDYSIYRQLLLTRYRVQNHYATILHSIQHLLHSNNHDNHYYTKPPPHFIQSMQKLNQTIKHIERSIKFIKGNHKYILLNILHKLKLQYQTDTQLILDKWNNEFS